MQATRPLEEGDRLLRAAGLLQEVAEEEQGFGAGRLAGRGGAKEVLGLVVAPAAEGLLRGGETRVRSSRGLL